MLLLTLTGCSTGNGNRPGVGRTLSVVDILERCADRYEAAESLRARGLLRDNRNKGHRTVPIGWDYARPDRCRLQIDMAVALVSEDGWWTYDPVRGDFKTHRQITNTPIETAAALLSNGVPFLLPAVWQKGRAGFGLGAPGPNSGWTLQGPAWYSGHPCYLVWRSWRHRERGTRLKVWIDQDSHLLRGWTLERVGSDGPSATICGCTYYDVSLDALLTPERFRIDKPTPIVLPQTAGG